MAETPLEIKIIPGIPPDDRHNIEDALGGKGLDVAGGGGFDDGSESDIMTYSEKPTAHLQAAIRILRKANVGKGSYIIVNKADNHPVYSDSEHSSVSPWWKFW